MNTPMNPERGGIPMRSVRKLVAAAALLSMVALVAAGCSQYARHPDKDAFGEAGGSMDDALANMDRMMKMDMRARKAHMMEKEKFAVEAGRKLFNDARLGSNGQTCNSCHPGGGTTGGETEIAKKMGHGPYRLPIPSLMGAAARFPKYKVPNDGVITLEMMDNNCIRMFMKGKRLPENSPEAYYLARYVTSLSSGDDVNVGK